MRGTDEWMQPEYYERAGLRLEGRAGSNDYQIIGEVIDLDCYRIQSDPLPSDALVVDIGGHIGTFSVLAASLGAKRVIAFEMDPGNFEILSRNAVGWPAIEVHHAAVVGRGRRAAGYNVTPGNTGGHHVAWTDEDGMASMPEKTATLDVLLADRGIPYNENIDMLKIDCEGCEHEILRACAQDGTLRRIQRIAGEYHDFFGDSTESLLELLRLSGFTVESEPIGDHSGTFYGVR